MAGTVPSHRTELTEWLLPARHISTHTRSPRSPAAKVISSLLRKETGVLCGNLFSNQHLHQDWRFSLLTQKAHLLQTTALCPYNRTCDWQTKDQKKWKDSHRQGLEDLVYRCLHGSKQYTESAESLWKPYEHAVHTQGVSSLPAALIKHSYLQKHLICLAPPTAPPEGKSMAASSRHGGWGRSYGLTSGTPSISREHAEKGMCLWNFK